MPPWFIFGQVPELCYSTIDMNPEELLREVIPGYGLFYQELPYRYDAAFFGRRPIPGTSFAGCEVGPQGFRLRPSLTEISGGYRVLLGDSVTFGVGILDPRQLLSSQIEQRTQVPILDLSTRANRIEQQVLVLFNHLTTQQYPIRDVYLWAGYADLLWWLLSGGCKFGHFGIEPPALGLRDLLLFSAKRRLGLQKNRPGGRSFYWKKAEWSPEDLPSFATYLAGLCGAIAMTCKGLNANFRLLIQPMQLEPGGNLDPRSRLYCDQRSEWVRKEMGHGKDGFESLASLFRTHFMKELDRRAIPYWDMQPCVSPDDFFDQVHLKPSGHAKVADLIARLGQNNLLDSQSRQSP